MFSNLEEIDDSYYMKEETFHNDWMMFYLWGLCLLPAYRIFSDAGSRGLAGVCKTILAGLSCFHWKFTFWRGQGERNDEKNKKGPREGGGCPRGLGSLGFLNAQWLVLQGLLLIHGTWNCRRKPRLQSNLVGWQLGSILFAKDNFQHLVRDRNLVWKNRNKWE